ncbi:hypothetical protein LTR99_002446 [Exophiala xenobiotica]|uniref:PLC-like phosphodiesterase n=1 Tax=Vermiconidia calcicola TaxID=1690605 RepID=A0AAV9QJ60_9PEZI|nr:hypothetical protein LTR96_002685 [Exophiala xenobiotica]KAK5541481.1 hypothetical protein LTR23_005803 [Chaetothyriales sp. CCFEE 6169]KAK5542217.1 hypothetical protein LTR25_002102 [Vermiconidia calcicola]KAK5306754.1 hypothetical protein LTR99_002446 [Exophiala xenobiotica]KAK5341267.1 hypothetical protein LTR98_002059 [Exophiala xenobiotica]
MQLSLFALFASLALQASAQSISQSDSTTDGSTTDSSSVTSTGADYASGTYADESSTITFTGTTNYATISDLSSVMATGNATATAAASSSGSSNATTTSTSSATATVLSGTARTTSLNGTMTGNSTATATSSSATPTNTVPCNGHSQFCQRKYSNITQVAAHNSPFVRSGNLAANQVLDVTTQLNDGIRMLQFQAHLVNGTLYLCHTSCDLLNVGTLQDYLTTVTRWLRTHNTDVITILIGNYDLVDPGNFTAPVINSGLIDFVYTPPTLPMPLDSWPTLAEMIFRQTRAVVMLDYQANQTAIPWLLDEFSQMWETPFSPTDRDFPCTAQRPPNQAVATRENRMYMANHNLNLDVNLAGISMLVPFFPLLNETNAVTGYGSAGRAVENCTTKWNRPPNFLLVDYYNLGSFNGSVFQVAADANNVTYDRSSCCGTAGTSAAIKGVVDSRFMLTIIAVAAGLLLL